MKRYGSLFRPGSGLITAAVKNSRDQDVSVVPIVDDVALNDDRSDAFTELGSIATHARVFDE